MAFQETPNVTAKPRGYNEVNNVVAATGLTLPALDVNAVLITVEGGDVRWRDDGVDPTAAVGHPLAVGQSLEYNGVLTAIKFIEQAAGSPGKLRCSYYFVPAQA